MANKDFQNGLIVGLAAGSTPVTVTTDWGDTITDDWDTIIANANAGTVSGYSIGDTKTLEFIYDGTPLAVQFMIVDKSHETISGTQNKAALTFMAKYRQLWGRTNSTNTNAGGYMAVTGDKYSVSLDEIDGALVNGSDMRKDLWLIYKAFPSNLQTAIKTVDKMYDDADNSLQTSKEKFFLPCAEELGLSGTATYQLTTGQGTVYSYFSDANNRKLTGIGNTIYLTRSRRASNTTNFIGCNSVSGVITGNTATGFAAVCPCICL
jgi:hypothetical protein